MQNDVVIQRRVGIVAVVVVVAATLALVLRPPIKEPAFSHELIALQREIDDLNVYFTGPGGRFSLSDIPDELRDRVEQQRDIDQENMDRLRPLLERFGWPTEKMVGREAVQAAHNVVGRAPSLEFKEYAVELMRRVGADDNFNYARLVDQIAVGKGEPQTYGTQWTCVNGEAQYLTPVKDPARAEELREQVGLDPFEQLNSEFCFREFGDDIDEAPVLVEPGAP